MSLAITDLELTDVNTISIPTDAILILSLLVIFTLLGYLFHNILNTQTNQFIEKIDENSNLELDQDNLADQLILDSATMNHEKSVKQSIKTPKFLPSSKFLGISSLALLAIGGSSLLRIQNIQNSYKGVHTSQVNIQTENQSAKSLLTIAKIKSPNQSQTQIKKISYADPLLSTNNTSKNSNFHMVKQREAEDFFSF